MTTARRPTHRPPEGGSKETTRAAASANHRKTPNTPETGEDHQTTTQGTKKQP